MKYCEHIFNYKRRPTHEVMVGDIGIGAQNPIRIQSMTIADTMDTVASVEEVAGLAAAGCEIVRLTAPSIKEAENLKNIQAELQRRKVNVPLVADIHYTPNAALVAADYVQKVRINPGNYADKKKFAVRDYTDAEYESELTRVYERFAPLVKKCKTNGVAMRIGVNHGSLADRIMNRFGDTPEGMVQSALEFVAICEDLGYYNIVLSMKSSMAAVMIQAYRLLATRFYERGMTYPFHVGVTEAGNGEDGRIKSAVGIGALLEDGLGDTVRVSLTEDAVFEIPVAAALVKKYNEMRPVDESQCRIRDEDYLTTFQPLEPGKHKTSQLVTGKCEIGGDSPVRVAIHADMPASEKDTPSLKVLQDSDNALYAEWIFTGRNGVFVQSAGDHQTFSPENKNADILVFNHNRGVTEQALQDVINEAGNRAMPLLLSLGGEASTDVNSDAVERIVAMAEKSEFADLIIALEIPADRIGALSGTRQLLFELKKKSATFPLLLCYAVHENQSNWQLDAAATLGSLLCDGFGDGVYIHGSAAREDAVQFAFTLLQATRSRITKTEFISCPSCGRTLFNLQHTTSRIQQQTGHLKGVKIAIMGCIVNGPGEMADADFGYVGAGPGKVNLFVGKECVEKYIPEEEADQRLIALIKKHDKWTDPEVAQIDMESESA